MIKNLSGKFEKREEEPPSQPGGECSSKGRGKEKHLILEVMNISNLEYGLVINSNEKDNASFAFLKFSKSDSISTNERSRRRNHVPSSRQNVTNQRTACRKRKVAWREGNLDKRTPKQTRFNSECNRLV